MGKPILENLGMSVCISLSLNYRLRLYLAGQILMHKIHSPQEREVVQALAALEACVRSCGTRVHAEVESFKFLNEPIKLISPRY